MTQATQAQLAGEAQADSQREQALAFGAKIRSLRENRGLSQLDLAERHKELTQTFISGVETGRIVPSLRKVRVLAEALGVSRNWLMVEAGLLDPDDVSEARDGLTTVERDILDYARQHKQLRKDIERLRSENDDTAYQYALAIIHRSLASGVATARDALDARRVRDEG